MVSPMYIIAILLAAAFLLPAVNKFGSKMIGTVFFTAITAVSVISYQWIMTFLTTDHAAVQIFTAGFQPPISINFQIGLMEAILITLINLGSLLGAVYSVKYLSETGVHAFVMFLLFILGMNGLILTRDVFNTFVFIEIISIATFVLIAMDVKQRSLSAGFKYMIAGGISSVFMLLGIILLYKETQTLNIDGMVSLVAGSQTALIFTGSFILIFSILIELKVFPANGWALDVYENSNTGISAMLSAVSATTLLFVLYKLIPLVNSDTNQAVAIIGMGTFLVSNFFGLKQENSNRLLGYSSVGQIGLLIFIIANKEMLGSYFNVIFFSILISHYFAKSGLFWLSGILKQEKMKDWSNLRKKPVLVFLFGTFVFLLLGFPPFPSFFGKWELIMQLFSTGNLIFGVLILVASFFEGVYLFRWFGFVLKQENEELPQYKTELNEIVPPIIFAVAAYIAGYFTGTFVEAASGLDYIPLIFIALIGLIDFTPAWVKNTLSIAGVILLSFYNYSSFADDLLRQIFAVIFLGGAVLVLFAGYYYKGRRSGFHVVSLAMFLGLFMLIKADNLLEVFYSWELMTIGSYFLLIRGKKSMPHGYSYMMFSLGGSYAIMIGFALAFASSGSLGIDSLSGITIYPAFAYSLMLLGFMTKTASFGLHIWLPGAHGEAVVDIHFMASAILLKAGVFGIILVLTGMGTETYYAKNIIYVLGWIGALSALVGNLEASFQESAKRLLAWSSIGQLGYIVFGLALMSHLGWTAALFYTLTHFLYKGILFLVIGGIALKLGTPYMYRMGGLIKRMPFSFVAVLIAIIALSGVPPLVGFAGKWIFYNAIISQGMYLQGIVVLFSGIIAFLYLFKLIYSVFLGPIKDEHRRVKELPAVILIPVYILIASIMVLSARADLFLKPLGKYLESSFPTGGINWSGTMARTALGHWDGFNVMIIVVVAFTVILMWLIFASRKAQKVEMFNIVYSGERPESPQTTHFSHNMFSHYMRGVGFLTLPFVTGFWDKLNDILFSSADFFRKFYNGNGQVYALHIFSFVLLFYFAINGGLF